ncbi:MAG: HupE/UreJ family protein [Verrucomicrobia bacterium]|nr:HupE/UreJ family protein [Verrucomicrobiota bacterium]
MACVCCPFEAQAHLVSTGFGPFYDGISHFLVSPDEWLGVVGLSLLAGLGGARCGRLTLLTIPLAWFAGGLLGAISLRETSAEAVTGFSLLTIGLLVALDRRWPLGAVLGAAGMFGVMHGFFNGTTAGQTRLGVTGLLGIAASVFVVVALLSASTVSLSNRPPWTRVMVRVAGSWIAAVGLLMAGWALR